MNPTHRRHGAIPVLPLRALLGLAGMAASARYLRRGRSRPGPRRVSVEGLSMVPTLEPGDRLLVRRTVRFHRGDLLAFRDPRDPARIMIKRARTVSAAGIDVRGDNPSRSTDSRAFGLVTPDAVIGRAWYRYAPPGRTGRLPAPDRPGS